MAKKKKFYDPRQLSFTFDVMADHIENIRAENNTETKEVQNVFRQTNRPIRNSNESVRPKDNKGSTNNSRTYELSLFDSRQVGIELPRGIEKTGEQGSNGLNNSALRSTGFGKGHPDQRFSLGDEAIRLDTIRDPGEEWNQPRIVNNFIIDSDIRLGSGGVAVKYADNIKALELLKNLADNNRKEATLEEQQILVRYVGWGGMPQAFDFKNEYWKERYEHLRLLLNDSDYAKARRSTQDAHYTSETVIQGIYAGLSRIGIHNNNDEPLRILEPASGIGNFIGLFPTNLPSEFVAIEQDTTTSKIAEYLYPAAQHLNNGFQNIPLPDDRFDIVVGNPPFGQQALFDPLHADISKFSIHNYFLAKSILKLREGGIAAFVVSRYFMDSVDPKTREYIAEQANFLGAIRLPKTAFKENALTEVTTDIVFFQKNSTGLNNKDWLVCEDTTVYNNVDKKEDIATINSYFINNPTQIIGELVYESSSFGKALACKSEDIDLAHELKERIACLPPNIFIPRPKTFELLPVLSIDKDFIDSPYFKKLKIGARCVEPNSKKIIYKCLGDFGVSSYKIASITKESEQVRTRGMIAIRDTLRNLINLEKSDAPSEKIESLRHKLNIVYDNYIKKFGYLNSQYNRSLMHEDPESALIESLEVAYDKGISKEQAVKQNKKPIPASAKKATIFNKRVLTPDIEVLSAESARDALIVCLREKGRVDFSRMTQLTNISPENLKKELQGQSLIFLNPINLDWEIRDKYLTGNVREKLKIAEQYAQNSQEYLINVTALKDAMPAEIEAVDIGIKFGSTWIPKEVLSDFVNEIINEGNDERQTIEYMPILSKWKAKISISNPTINDSIWGMPEFHADKILEALLQNHALKILKETGNYNEEGKPIYTLDQDLTAALTQKADAIKQAFVDWVWTDNTRRDTLSKIYNERFNTHVPPRYDGSDLQLVGASSQINLRPHQKNVIWRSIQEGTALFDHRVGAGKTLACIATIMESRRMGFTKKPMIVVPNHLVYAWRDEFFKLYPNASILVAEKKDFIKQNRERFFSRIATGDWDAVILAHSSFKKINMPHETQAEILKEQIDIVIATISESENERSHTTKMLEKQRESISARYDKLINSGGEKDNSVDFSDLGVDALFIDESQEFKNLGFATTMNVSGLGNIAGSAKALDLFIKCRYLQKKNDNRGVYFLTGTPISNSISEVYTLQRYLQYDELENKGIGHFDSWASTFGQITNGWELDSTGVNYKLKSRFAKFQNIPELLAMYRTVADVVTQGDLDEQCRKAGIKPLAPALKGGAPNNIVAERSFDQAIYMDSIIYRMEHLPKDPRIDNPLKITNDARKAGLDFRMIDPSAEDFAGSKINMAVERIYEIWKSTAEDKGTQLVFCDLSTPKKQHVADTNISNFGNETSVDSNLVALNDDEDAELLIDMDELMALNSKFSVYNDMQKKLLKKGIPQGEIAFIHDANTDIRKAKLFLDVQNGDVRVLFGSTAKMGAGMNVQKRLIAAHHLDAPWRPSDVEQRNGRILRQGNMFYERDPSFEVEINYYATKQMYDARMWQTIEYKAAAIEQFRKGDLSQRVIDDTTSDAATAADMKAAASGNPFILIQVQLSAELRKLEALHTQHNREQHRLQDRLRGLSGAEIRFQKAKNIFDENIKHRDFNTYASLQGIYVDGNFLDKEDNAKIMKELKDKLSNLSKNAPGQGSLIGVYRGFNISVQRKHDGSKFCFSLHSKNERQYFPDNLIYDFNEKFSLKGFFQRLANFLDNGLEQGFQNAEKIYKQELEEINNVKANLNKDFPLKAELTLCRENNNAVIAELHKMCTEAGYVSDWQPATGWGVGSVDVDENKSGNVDVKLDLINNISKINSKDELKKASFLEDVHVGVQPEDSSNSAKKIRMRF